MDFIGKNEKKKKKGKNNNNNNKKNPYSQPTNFDFKSDWKQNRKQKFVTLVRSLEILHANIFYALKNGSPEKKKHVQFNRPLAVTFDKLGD